MMMTYEQILGLVVIVEAEFSDHGEYAALMDLISEITNKTKTIQYNRTIVDMLTRIYGVEEKDRIIELTNRVWLTDGLIST